MKRLNVSAVVLAMVSLVNIGNANETSPIANIQKAPVCIGCSANHSTEATVANIDAKKGMAVLKNEHGQLVKLGDINEIERFKKGDTVTLSTAVKTDIIVTKGALENKIRTNGENLARLQLSKKSKAELKQTAIDQAKIIDLEFKTKTVTLESMHGIYSVIADSLEEFATLRVGDIVTAINTKSIQLSR